MGKLRKQDDGTACPTEWGEVGPGQQEFWNDAGMGPGVHLDIYQHNLDFQPGSDWVTLIWGKIELSAIRGSRGQNWGRV